MELVCLAYRARPNEIVGGPAWLYSNFDVERFEILAKMPDDARPEQVPEMLQALLAERFKLVAHREKKDTSVYALVVGKGGPKLKEAVPGPPAPAGAAEASAAPQGAEPKTGDAASRLRMKVGENGEVRYESDSMSLAGFATVLSQAVDRPVVDQTGVKGNYQVSYGFSLSAQLEALENAAREPGQQDGNPAPPPGAASDPRSSIFSSVQQLGLKLEPRKLPWNVVVIDHIDNTPTEN